MTTLKPLFLIILIAIAFNSCSQEPMDESDKLANIISLKTVQELKKYDLKMVGIGQGGDEGKIKLMILKFNLEKILTKNESRKLLLTCTEEFLNQINNFQEIQPFLSNHPFMEKNIELTIFLSSDKKFTPPLHPYISSVTLYKNQIIYKTSNKDLTEPFISIVKETVDEAKKILQEERERQVFEWK